MAVDLSRFENPWEHVRLLSDRGRNEALLELLARRAPGARVLEIGCGTGLLSCVAARLGAAQVIAVEPTPLVDEARAMVEANGLGHVVRVVRGRVQDLPPEPVDVVFSELLNADPFAEGVMDAMAAGRRWLVDGGFASPRRLRILAAAVRDADSAMEVRDARREVARLSARYGLELGRLDALCASPGPYPSVRHVGELATEPAVLWDLEVGVDPRPSSPVTVDLEVREPGPVGGVAVWFEAEVDDGIEMHNRPGTPNHWGQLVCCFAAERGIGLGGRLRITAWPDPDGLRIEPGAAVTPSR